MTYTVSIDDNFHFMQEDERYTSGTFATAEEAKEHCKALIKAELNSYLEQGIAVDKLAFTWGAFGEDPWINPDCGFSSRDFVERCCREKREARHD